MIIGALGRLPVSFKADEHRISRTSHDVLRLPVSREGHYCHLAQPYAWGTPVFPWYSTCEATPVGAAMQLTLQDLDGMNQLLPANTTTSPASLVREIYSKSDA